MTKTQRKDAWKTIKKYGVSFLSIAIVIALGAGIFLMCLFSRTAIYNRGNAFYQELHYHDLEVRATGGIEEADIAAVLGLEPVVSAEGIYAVDMVMKVSKPAAEDQEEPAAASAEVPPSKEGEEVLKDQDKQKHIAPIHVVSMTESMDDFIVLEGEAPKKADECAVAESLAEEYQLKPGDRIEIDGLSEETSLLRETKYLVTGIIRQPDDYHRILSMIDNVLISPEAVDTEKIGAPYTGIVIRLDTTANTFSDQYRRESDAALLQIMELGKERETQKYQENLKEIQEEIREGEEELEEAKRDLEEARKEIEENENKLEEAQDAIAAAEQELNENRPMLEALGAWQQIAENERLIEEKQAEYDKAEEELKEARKELEESQKEYDDGEEELEDAKEKMDELEECSWMILPRTVNVSWKELHSLITVLSSIGYSFALLFILLSILVCYTTVGRIIDEESGQVGVTMALGYQRSEILGKYLLFSMSGTAIGLVLGILLAYFILENLMLQSTIDIFLMTQIPKSFDLLPTLLTAFAALFFAAFATWIACRKLIKLPAIRLISGDLPGKQWKKRNTKAAGRSLYSSMTWRNMKSDWKRVLITVASIAGSTMLMVTGFSMKQASVEVIRRQFDEIQDYDALVSFITEEDGVPENEIEKILADAGAEYLPIHTMNTLLYNKDTMDMMQFVCIDPSAAREYFHLTDAETKEELQIPETGILVSDSYAKEYGLKKGDRLAIGNTDGKIYYVDVSGIYVNYVGRMLFLSEEYAKNLFGDTAKTNAFLIRYEEGDGKIIKEQVSRADGFLDYTEIEDTKVQHQETANLMDFLIIASIVIAIIMAAAVILNLIRIQVHQKKRELTILRILGYSTQETVAYILRENILTTAAGIVLGLVIGYLVAQYCLSTQDRIDLQMVKDILLPTILFPTIITIGFAAVINFFALRKIRFLKLNNMND